MKLPFKNAILVSAFLANVPLARPAENLEAKSSEAPTGSAALFGDPVIARGQGVEIKRSQLEGAYTTLKASLAARGQTIPEAQRIFRESQLLDNLVVTRLLINRANAGDKAVAKGRAEKYAADRKNDVSSEDAFNAQLKAQGLTPEEFNKQLYEEALAEAVLDRELKSTLVVSNDQMQAFYNSGSDGLVKIMQEELERLAKDPSTSVAQLAAVKQQIEEIKKTNLARLEQPEKVRVMHLLILTRNRDTEEELPPDQKKLKRLIIDKLLVRARAGEDFSKLVLENSEDRHVKENKGEYTLARSEPFAEEFKAAAFTLNTNQISDIVTTTFGYHIIKCLEKIPARKVEFQKASTDIKDFLLQQELQSHMPEYFERLKREAHVEILEPKYKLLSSKSTPLPDSKSK